jgi:nitronate monooxygenase
MAISTNLTQRLGVEHPVLLAPMGFVAGGALAAAVSAAGGFGIIGGGYADPDWLERECAAAGHRPVGCGFITWALAERPASLDVALKHQPAAIMLSFGDAAAFLPKIKRAGALAMCQIQSLAQARAVLREGADIIVAQGTEAGGHGGGRSTLPLVPAVVDMVAGSGRSVPVVAAGGITDGRGLAAALMLGADGVLMGTRFSVASESLAAPGAKARRAATRRCARPSSTSLVAIYGRRSIRVGPSGIASPRRGMGAKTRWRGTQPHAPAMPRRQRGVTRISPSCSQAKGLISFTRSNPLLPFLRA